MAVDQVRYRFRSIRIMRGTETRTIDRWEGRGWESTSRSTGRLTSELTFRRPGRPGLRAALGALTAVAVLAVGTAAAYGVLTGPRPDPVSATDRLRDNSASATPTPTPTPSPTPNPTSTPVGASSTPTPTGSPAGPLAPSSASRSAGSAPADTAVVTAANTPIFRAILAEEDYCDPRNQRFAEAYRGRTIAYDGSVVSRTRGERFDLLTAPGDMGSQSVRGPALQFPATSVADMHLSGAGDIPADATFRFVAQVATYDADQCLFALQPISTTAR